ncbi:hypothetical protein [Moritella sp. Urea-trap-13]|uniref:hypothetical protein n=1 Tax=Moritella sp. Urea-trap-13 TaxID=2058327 RepID=UPI000C3262B6|nr:hypothetical protein [Moritella sp. Urea-trap-13]PKH07470.1 hypothetical protein CXF93_07310 [Moritella sp. Urea-trap-13]
MKNIIENTKQATPKNCSVNISASFELQLKYHFSDVEIQESGGLITDAFDNLIFAIEEDFSSISIDIYFESAKRRRKDNTYKLTGSIERCYLFSENDIDDDEELFDGVFESELQDMKMAVEHACGMGYELIIINFNWIYDEVVNVY